jgi:PAS domain S-box-containing protein
MADRLPLRAWLHELWRDPAARIATIYVAVAAGWIVASDRLLLLAFPDSSVAISNNQTFKGLFFITLSALILFLLVRRAIRHRKSVEAELDRSEARFELIVEGIDDYSICLLDGEGRIASWNRGAERMTGYRAGEVIGLTLDQLSTPKDRVAGVPADLLARARESGRVADRGWRVAKDGRCFLAESTITALRGPAGRVEGFVSFARDVTEQQALSNELSQAQERLNLALQSGNVGLWDWDIGTDAIYLSPEWKAQLGFADDEMENRAELFNELLHPDDRETVRLRQDAALSGANVIYDVEVRLRHRDGGWRWIHTRGRVLRDAAGRPVRMIGVHSDVTERRHTEAQLRQALRMEAIGQLTGGVAHDFNNLLTVVMGNAELLRDRLEDDPAGRQLADTALAAAERGAALTHRLLAFARRETLVAKRVEPNLLVAGVLPLLVRTLGEDVEIASDLGADLWDLMVDAHQLENCLINLAVNARDAMPKGGHVVIATRKRVVRAGAGAVDGDGDALAPGEYVEILVGDDGEGMAPEVLQRAFEPFFTTKDVGKGSGLGLSMVYGFARQSGGLLEMESAPGRGTTVRLLLPRAPPNGDGPASIGLPDAAGDGQGERLLVVEDDAAVRQLMAGLLRQLGYQVTEAADGPQALEAAAAGGTLDLLVTDMVMPRGMNGAALADRLRDSCPALPVLFVSGYSDRPLPGVPADGEAPAGAGPVDRNLGKPFSRRALARAVRRTLDAARAAHTAGP